MEPQVPGKLSPAVSSSPQLELVGVLSTSGPDRWKFGIPVSYKSAYFILSASAGPLFIGHIYQWPAPNMEFEGSPHDRLWRCSLVSWGQSSNLLQYPVRKVGIQKRREKHWGKKCPPKKIGNFSHLLPTLFAQSKGWRLFDCDGMMDYCWGVATEMIGAGYLKRWKWSDFFVCFVVFFLNWMHLDMHGHAQPYPGHMVLPAIVSCRELSCA